MKKIRQSRAWAAVAVAVLAAALLSACGSDDKKSSSSSSSAPASAANAAFLQGMVAHHTSAVDMAEVAKRRGQRKEIKTLATNIVTTQTNESSQMKSIYKRLYGKQLKPSSMAHQKLGLSAKQAGMEKMDMSGLETAKPFDRAFIDAMVPHHQGAIRMARAVLQKTRDMQIKNLAGAIVSEQSREIRQMNSWRMKWYGSASPAGGVPSSSSSTKGKGGMDMKGKDGMDMSQ